MKKKKNALLNPKNYMLELTRCLESLDKTKIELIIDVLVAAYKKDRNVFILVNGGVASTSSHMVLPESGDNPNMVKAVEHARLCGAETIGILGFKTEGKLGNMVDYSIIVDSKRYGPIENAHLVLNYIIAAWIVKVENIHDPNPFHK